MRRFLFGSALFGLLTVAMPAIAHEFWIQPAHFRAPAGRPLAIELRVGEGLPGESLPRRPDRFSLFRIVGPGGASDVPGLDGRAPAGFVREKAAGLRILGYRSGSSWSKLPPAKFRAYLEEDGLEHVIEAREKRGEEDEPGREVYSRCAKSIFRVLPAGGESAAGDARFDHRFGFPLEIVPEADPTRVTPGGDFLVLVLHRGKPLSGALVRAQSASAPDEVVRVRTDAEGRARVRIRGVGMHLVSVVHMVRAPEESKADWESFWASLTFEPDRGRPSRHPIDPRARR